MLTRLQRLDHLTQQHLLQATACAACGSRHLLLWLEGCDLLHGTSSRHAGLHEWPSIRELLKEFSKGYLAVAQKGRRLGD